jgi:uncharacterized protein involved in exopolysaccharide biosynthesis
MLPCGLPPGSPARSEALAQRVSSYGHRADRAGPPNKRLNLALGLLVGLALGVGLAATCRHVR